MSEVTLDKPSLNKPSVSNADNPIIDKLAPYIQNNTLTLPATNTLGAPNISALITQYFSGQLVVNEFTLSSKPPYVYPLVYTGSMQSGHIVVLLSFNLVNAVITLEIQCTIPTHYRLTDTFPNLSTSYSITTLTLSNAEYTLNSEQLTVPVSFMGTVADTALFRGLSWLVPDSFHVYGTFSIENGLNQPTINLTGSIPKNLQSSGYDITCTFKAWAELIPAKTYHDTLYADQLAMAITLSTPTITIPMIINLMNGQQYLLGVSLDTSTTLPSLGELSDLSSFVDSTALTQAITALSDKISLSNLTLNQFSMVVDPIAQQFSQFYFQIVLNTDWEIISNILELQQLSLSVSVQDISSPAKFSWTLGGILQVGSAQLLIDILPQEQMLYATLQSGNTASTSDLFSVFAANRVTMPGEAATDTIQIGSMSLSADIKNNSYSLSASSIGSLTIVQDLTISALDFSIDYSNSQLNNVSFGALFTIANTFTLFLQAMWSQDSNNNSEWTFTGETGSNQPIPIGSFIGSMATQYGFNSDVLPEAISSLTLSNVTFGYSTSSYNQALNFGLQSTFQLAKSQFDITVAVELVRDGSGYTTTFQGTLLIGTYQFNLTYSDAVITAEFNATNSSVDINHFIKLLGMDYQLPDAINIAIDNVGFTYNTSTNYLILTATSVKFGQVLLAAFPTQSTSSINSPWQFFFGLAINQTLNLSDLPLVSEVLNNRSTVSIGNIQALVSSSDITQTEASAINALINKTPFQIPTAGMSAHTAILSMTINVGADQTKFSINIGEHSAQQNNFLPSFNTVDADVPVILSNISDSSTDVIWFTIQKSFGPVAINRIGALYQSTRQILWFKIDADLEFGPLSVSLAGLGLGSPLSTFSPQMSLQGLGISYAKPPLTVAGSFVNLAPGDVDYYEFEGGVTIGTQNLSLNAEGFYSNKEGYSSMFIFGNLAYDFGGPPAFFVTGVALGFGYNSKLRIPTINEVQTFPLVQVLPKSTVPNTNLFGPNPTPQTVLDCMQNLEPSWIAPQADSLWFAAGVTFTSFGAINSQALVVVSQSSDLVVALVGTSRAQFPQNVSSTVYANIEMNLLARFAPSEGVFSVQAVLSKSSFLIDPACILRGGFAFFVWFGNNAHAGDFLVTLGGYHPGFSPPSYYPVVPRVGFNWMIDSSISISGGAYLAFTPSVLMVGGNLNAVYQSGDLKAWFNAHADIIINWNPFWFDAQIGILIGASYKIDWYFTTTTVSVELGCELELYGPPTGGSVSVDWYIISFTVPFGARDKPGKNGNTWDNAVEAMLPNTNPDPHAPANVLLLTPIDGLLAQSNSDPTASKNANWTVRAGQFSFSATSPIPVNTIMIGTSAQPVFQEGTFGVYPLDLTGVTATQSITIQSSTGEDATSYFEQPVTLIKNNLPTSLWGTPPTGGIDTPPVPAGDAQLVMGQVVGVKMTVVTPILGNSAGPVDVEANLQYAPLNISGAIIYLASPHCHDVPSNNQGFTTPIIVQIGSSASGINSPSINTSRQTIYDSLSSLPYAPFGMKNDPLDDFTAQIGQIFAAEPLMVSAHN